MERSTIWLTAADGTAISTYVWSGDVEPRAIVLIAHGMGEHAARYDRLASALVEAGFVVYAQDHRGHGHTAGSPEHYGDLGPGGWQALVDDFMVVCAHSRAEHPGIPVVMVGHSMGSFALQQYLLDDRARLDGAVLSGTSAVDVISQSIDPLVEVDLSAFNAPFEPAPTEYEWLSRDRAEVDRYVADPMCGFGLQPAGTIGMLDGIAAAADPKDFGHLRDDFPILLLSGSADPLAGGGELIELVASRYRAAGLDDVTVNVYPDARHEIFNETNRDEVTADLIAWLDRVVS